MPTAEQTRRKVWRLLHAPEHRERTNILPLDGGFQAGDQVVDLTAEAKGWPDREGEVIDIDGSGVKVRYASGTERWKRHISLSKKVT